ncbi:prenyltransferase [Thalassomonas sp. M1454]|uniref:prenyltransferase n=1 Tax=Thalassomonas sp. M1454 TaxID=2594477 RepID=UPI00163D7FEF|nr:prenyltransferase [Thalassomonas sp. M1454]
MRLSFLTLTLFCVLVGFATAVYAGTEINWLSFSLCLIGALIAHIAVNTLNEYQDFQSGLDFKTDKTPFSGGSGGLVENPNAASLVLNFTYLCIALVIFIGLYFIATTGLGILPFGLIGIVIIITYTRYINTQAWLCLFAPGFAFGLLIVVATDYILTLNYSLSALASGVVCLFLVSNVLLLSQFPDANADKTVGRKHIVIAYGKKFSLSVYLIFTIFAGITLILSCFYDVLPKLAYLALIPMLAGVEAWRTLSKSLVGSKIANQPMNKALALNVIAANVTPLLLSICILVASTSQSS